MGLFDFIGEKIREAAEEKQDSQMDAERWDAKTICRELKRTSGLMKMSGYMNALKSKCYEMDDWELTTLFDSEYASNNTKAVSAMMPVMQDRGLVYVDSNGKMTRRYR
jgi:hypothetical protein